ncbi:MAG: type II secretion system major pseudopilin GspG [Phycisphaerae bacterium]
MSARNRIRRARRAFTLLEVLMVVVIIGILAAVFVTNVFRTGDNAKVDLAKAAVTSGLNGSLDRFRLDVGRYPSTEEGLMALIQAPSDEDVAKKWRGPYADPKLLRDPWEKEWSYQAPGQYNAETYDLSSGGKNTVPGDDDDVRNWERS